MKKTFNYPERRKKKWKKINMEDKWVKFSPRAKIHLNFYENDFENV